jgi:hypothetical protein
LKSVDSSGHTYPPCSTHLCRFNHVSLSTMSKTEKIGYVTGCLFGTKLRDALKAIG